jgi:hypothetical protein
MSEPREFMFANFARSTLAAGISASATLLRVPESQGDIFPNVDPTYSEIFAAVLTHGSAYEIVYVTQKAADVFTIERGKEGTTPTAFPEGALIVHTVTAGFFTQQANAPVQVIAPVLSGELSMYGAALLSWTVPSQPISGYELERSVDGGAFALLEQLGEVNEYEDATVVSPSTYSYRIKAISSIGDEFDSEYSNAVGIDTAFFETFMLIHVEGGQIYEVTGFPAVTPVGDGEVSSVQSRFGTQSYHNPGTSNQGTDFVRVEGDADDFVFPGEFTWEGWFYINAFHDIFDNFFANNINFPTAGFIQLARWNSNSSFLFNSSAGSAAGGDVIPTGEWIHVAVTRDAADDIRIFMNGVSQIAPVNHPGTIGGDVDGVSSFDVCRGQASDNADLDCYFEEIRVTKACRYTANFTPPTEPFPPFPGI